MSTRVSEIFFPSPLQNNPGHYVSSLCISKPNNSLQPSDQFKCSLGLPSGLGLIPEELQKETKQRDGGMDKGEIVLKKTKIDPIEKRTFDGVVGMMCVIAQQ